MAKRDIIVVGGSMGSGPVLKALLGGLPADLPASLFITTHIPSTHASYLPEMLQSGSAIPVVRAVDGQPIEQGRAYVAAPDRHLLLVNGTIHLGAGPRENMVRPAIDPMFRSAALSYGPRAVGVVLTGLLNDGASGLTAIKQVGGAAVVQHPVDAQADEMPRAALEAVDADHVAPARDLAGLLSILATSDAGPSSPPSEHLAMEVAIAAGARLGTATLSQFAELSGITCPDCSGVLSEVRGEKPLRFRCQIGHAMTAEVVAAQRGGVDEAIRIALRVMEERVDLVARMARDARNSGRVAVAELYDQRLGEYQHYAATLREAAITTLRASRPPYEQPD